MPKATEEFSLYLAGGLFNAGERLHLLYLAKHLEALGWKVILPMREAQKHFDSDTQTFNVLGIVQDCHEASASQDNLYVGSLDGADADSGTAMEYGVAITSTGRAVVYRTDFRTDVQREIGINAMFSCGETKLVYHPCFFAELDQVDEYYAELAGHIDHNLKLLDLSGFLRERYS